MYCFEIKFIDKDFSAEKLEDVAVEGIKLYSDLDILLSCIRQNLIKSLSLTAMTQVQSMSIMSETLNQDKKQNFFKYTLPKDPLDPDASLLLYVDKMTDEQFGVLSKALSDSRQLEKLNLIVNQSMPLAHEMALIQVVRDNSKINHVSISGFISKDFMASMPERAGMNIIDFSIKGAKSIQEISNYYQSMMAQLKKEESLLSQASKMIWVHHLLWGLGLVALAGALVFMNSLLAGLGVSALALGTYSYFNQEQNFVTNVSMPMEARC
ncbi:MAG: hypothetical protein QG556_816 [Pseudomonadota bacterium]|nr:hypothetical protein [Pseudomonadota bacterium]NDH09600.1 hypothetical protein [Gammaproteobacteria bacterium]